MMRRQGVACVHFLFIMAVWFIQRLNRFCRGSFWHVVYVAIWRGMILHVSKSSPPNAAAVWM